MNSPPNDDASEPMPPDDTGSDELDRWAPEGAELADMLAEGALSVTGGSAANDPQREARGKSDSEKLLGSHVGPYALLKELGEGGFGMVYAARQREPVERMVALKVIKPGMDSREIIRRFEAERQVLAMMDHPNIATVLDAGATEDGRPYFAMELVDGVPITRYCDQARLGVQARLVLFLDVCAAIQHAHQKGVIHRDIKPTNILVAQAGDRPMIKVIDFGIAKALERRGGAVTVAGELMGTPQYMSPEQARGSGREIDTRSDIYGLGIVLYELLTGFTPLTPAELDRPAFAEIQRLIAEQTPSKPSTRVLQAAADPGERMAAPRGTTRQKLGHLLRGDLDWIVMKALEKEPGRRYESASRLAEDLQRHLRNDPVDARPPSRIYFLRKFIRRHRLAFAAGLAILISLVGGVAVSTALYLEEKESRAAAQQAFAQAETARKIADQERTRANRESRDARAISEFLRNDLLGRKAMSSGADPNIALRTVIAAAESKLSDRFTDRPIVEAEIRATLAGAYEAMGLYESALPHALRAGELFHQALGPTNRTTLDSDLQVAWMQTKVGNHAAAESMYEQCVTAARAILPRNDPAWIHIHNNRATLYSAMGRHAEAEAAFRNVLGQFDLSKKADRVRTLIFQRNLALALRQQENFAEARSIMEDVVRLSVGHLGERNVESVKSRYLLAGIKQDLGRNAEAREELELTLRLFHQLLGSDHHLSMENLNALAALYIEQGATNAALAIRRESAASSPTINRLRLQIAGLRRAGQTNRIPYFHSLRNLGFRLNDFGLQADAEDPFREFLALIPEDSPEAWRRDEAQFHLGYLLQAQGKLDEAKPFIITGVRGVWKHRETVAKAGAAGLIPIVLSKAAEFLETLGDNDEAAKWRQRLAAYRDIRK